MNDFAGLIADSYRTSGEPTVNAILPTVARLPRWYAAGAIPVLPSQGGLREIVRMNELMGTRPRHIAEFAAEVVAPLLVHVGGRAGRRHLPNQVWQDLREFAKAI